MNRRLVGRIVLVFFFVAWLFVVTFNYYVVHKPFNAEMVLALVNAFGDIFVLALLMLLAAALGNRLMGSIQFDSQMEGLLLRTGLGWGAVSFGIFALGLAGLLYPLAFWAVLILTLILLRNDLRVTLDAVRAIRMPIHSRFELALAAFVAMTLLLALVRALTPVLAWDAQVYHLAEGKFWISQGHIAAPPDIASFSYPSLVEMLYLGAFLLKGDILAQVIHWSFLLLTFGIVFLFAQRYFSTCIAWIASAFLAAVPSFVLIGSWPYVDAALAFYATAGLYAVTRARPEEGMVDATRGGAHWFVLAGAYAGLALGIKYTALIVPAALFIVIMGGGLNRFRLKPTVIFAVTAAFVAAPWYLRNWLFQGNPIYPFFFGGPFWDSFRSAEFSKFGTGFIGEPLRLLAAPWEATVLGQEGSIGFQATIGPLLLALLPFVFVTHRRGDRNLRRILIFAATLFGFWLVGIAESKELANTRLLFPAFPALAVVAAIGFDAMAEFDLPAFSVGRFARLVATFVLGLTLTAQVLDVAVLNPVPFLMGLESSDEFLSRHLTPSGYYDAMKSLAVLSPNDKVLFLWEPRSYYAQGRAQILPDALLDRFGDLRFRYGSPAAMANALRAEGYTHILLNRAGLNYFVTTQSDAVTRQDVAALQQMLSDNFRQISGHDSVELAADGSVVNAESDTYALYEILPNASAGR